MHERQLVISNKLGLHLRAATKLVQLASEFDADITITCNDEKADAKSIMDVLMLAAIIGSEVAIKVSGDSQEEETEVLEKLASLINNRFGENE